MNDDFVHQMVNDEQAIQLWSRSLSIGLLNAHDHPLIPIPSQAH